MGAKMEARIQEKMKKERFKIWCFLIGFWMHFGRDLGAKMGETSMQKRCQKHVGIDLEVQVAKTQKLTPLTAFLVFFQVKLGPKSIKNRRKIDPKSSKFFDQVFGSIFWRFLLDLAAILAAKMEPRTTTKGVGNKFQEASNMEVEKWYDVYSQKRKTMHPKRSARRNVRVLGRIKEGYNMSN